VDDLVMGVAVAGQGGQRAHRVVISMLFASPLG
jgi:hypothetical protein